MAIDTALILAAGAGTRLRPITNTRPKAMVKIVGKPILHHIILELQAIGIKKIFIVVKYKKENVIQYFQKIASDLKAKIEFIEQGERYGTAAAIAEAEGKIDSSFFAVAGDIITTKETFLKLQKEYEGKATVVLKKVENPENYGFATVQNNYITNFEEKPKKVEENAYANCSIYAFEPEIFKKIKEIKKSPRGEYEITDILKSQKAKAVVIEDYWLDMGLPWQLFDATKFIIQKSKEQREGLIEDSIIKGKVIVEKGAKIINSYLEGNIYIGKNTSIGPHSYIKGDSSIGEECSIGDSTTIKNSIIFDRVNAKHLTYIGDSIIGEECNFGAATQIANFRFDEGLIKAKINEVTIDTKRRKLGAIIGDKVKTGVLSAIMPGKMIGENSWIGAGVVIKENVPSDTYVELEQKLSYKKAGEDN
ncbi:MAG: bifunctional sugar-1-phosphate nucleotidylyltransferase/acetyltransferase [Candidatus Anstonellaceae archaeon]